MIFEGNIFTVTRDSIIYLSVVTPNFLIGPIIIVKIITHLGIRNSFSVGQLSDAKFSISDMICK